MLRSYHSGTFSCLGRSVPDVSDKAVLSGDGRNVAERYSYGLLTVLVVLTSVLLLTQSVSQRSTGPDVTPRHR
jgi:hypothetical protein